MPAQRKQEGESVAIVTKGPRTTFANYRGGAVVNLKIKAGVGTVAVGIALCGSCIFTTNGINASSIVHASSIVGSGTFSCDNISGHIKFHPALEPNGSSPETVTVKWKASDCTGGSPTPTSVTAVQHISFPANTCSYQQTGNLLPLGKLSFVPKNIESSGWGGFAYLEPDSNGNPTVTNLEPSEISPSYYSDFAAGTGAYWQPYPTWKSDEICTTQKVAKASFSDGLFAQF
jgi:hypothetical protein